jgi:hypothetical protein
MEMFYLNVVFRENIRSLYLARTYMFISIQNDFMCAQTDIKYKAQRLYVVFTSLMKCEV